MTAQVVAGSEGFILTLAGDADAPPSLVLGETAVEEKGLLRHDDKQRMNRLS